MTRWWKGLDPGSLLAILAFAIYLVTAGGHAYSTDGTFAFEMAKSAVLDPNHQYWGRFRTAFARWGVAMPAFAQPFVLGGAALGSLAPERDDLVVDGHRLRIETWPAVYADQTASFPQPEGLTPTDRVRSVTVVSYLANAATVPDGTTVAEIHLTLPVGTGNRVTLPIRAGIETSEWAWDRPDVHGTVAHRRAEVVGHWVGQPRGNLYVARLPIDPPQPLASWEAHGTAALGIAGTWEVRAVTFEVADRTAPASTQWRDARTGDRIWSERQSLDFWAQLGFGMANSVVTALEVLMVWRVAGHLGIPHTPRLVTAAGFAFGTIAWPYAKYDFSEPLAALAILIAFDAARGAIPLRANPDCSFEGALSPALGRFVAVVVVACLVAIAAKYAAAFAVAALAIEWAVASRPWVGDSGHRRRVITFGLITAAPFVAVGALALGILRFSTGETPGLLTSGLDRARDDWFTLPLWTGLRGLLFSSGKGLFVYAPWLLLAPVGMALIIARVWHGGVASKFGPVMLVGYPVLTVVAYSQKLVWHGGAWGPRYLVLALPWLALACAPVIEWALFTPEDPQTSSPAPSPLHSARGALPTRALYGAHLRAGRLALATLGTISVVVQLLAVAKHPEQFTAIARRHILADLPRFGADFGGRDYWEARGGELLGRALRDEASRTARTRNLGYLWGFPDASATIQFREQRDVQIGLYMVDWDQQRRTQSIEIEDAISSRSIDLGSEMMTGVWVVTTVQATIERPLVIRLRQTGRDTAVLSAITFDAATYLQSRSLENTETIIDPRALRIDRETAGDWPGRYGALGRIFPAFRNYNIDEVQIPDFVESFALNHVGDRPNPTIHVEIAEDDLLDTAILYAPPFSPLLGNAWLISADFLHLLAPSRPELASGILIRPPWRWFGIDAPRLDHPEYGLGLDFWPTIIWTNYASHGGVIAGAAVALVTIEVIGLIALGRLLGVAGASWRVRIVSVIGLGIAFAAYDSLMVLP